MTGPPIDVGMYVSQVSLSYPEIIERAKVAEDAGYHSLWFYDHLYCPGLPQMESFEAWTLATYVLAQTTRLRAGHLVLCNNFRHPALLAKMVSTIDVLSGGRFELGIGSGSVEREHAESGLPWGSFAERTERLQESLEILHRSFTGDPVSFDGAHYRVAGLPNLPPPLQRPHPPVHVGGIGPRRTLPLVARYADVWNVPTYGLDGWERSREVVLEECGRLGRDPATLRIAHEAVLVLVPDEASLPEARARAERRFAGPGWGLDAGGYVGTPTMVAERMRTAIAGGVSFFVFMTHDRAHPKSLELLAEAVLPQLG